MRIAVIGTGQLGSQIEQDFITDELKVFGFPKLDITKPESFTPVKAFQPEVIINCAAYTNVDKAEEERELAQAVNGVGPLHLAKLAKELNATLVHISTDYIFKGESNEPYIEDEPTAPLNYYGQTKLEGEQNVIKSGCRYLILRTAWLYGMSGPNFVLTMLNLAKTRPELKVVTDQIGSPTSTKELAVIIHALLDQKQEGIFNAVNAGQASKLELVEEIVSYMKLPTKLLPAVSSDFPTPAARPHYSVLSLDKLKPFYQPKAWQESLHEYLDTVSS